MSVTRGKKQSALGSEAYPSAEFPLGEGLSPGRRELSLRKLPFQTLRQPVPKPRLLSRLPRVTMETVSPSQLPAVPHPSPIHLVFKPFFSVAAALPMG